METPKEGEDDAHYNGHQEIQSHYYQGQATAFGRHYTIEGLVVGQVYQVCAQHTIGYQAKEVFIVEIPNTIVDPWTMVIHHQNTYVTD